MPGGRLGGEILKCKARSSRFLNFKRRKGFAVKKFGSRASFAKTKEHCDDRKLYGKKEFCRSRGNFAASAGSCGKERYGCESLRHK